MLLKKETPTVQTFIRNFEQQFQEPIPEGLHPDTRFRDLKEWTSLQALIIISSFDWDYGVSVSADELRNTNTINDLYKLVIQKIQE